MTDLEAGTPPVFPEGARDFANVLSHYYRGEISRMISWRERIDLTTNWAIGVVAGMLSLSLSAPQREGGVLILAMVVVGLILVIESRRYRFFHVYRSRVRLLERSYYAAVLSRPPPPDPQPWMTALADDLRSPRFSLTLTQAIARRLRRNYYWILLILLGAWLVETTGGLGAIAESTTAAGIVRAWIDRAGIGAVPGWVVVPTLLACHAGMIWTMLVHRETPGELAHGDVHV
jgi:uncharacterized membrane protein